MYKCVIFDFDGTLADTLPICISAFRKALSPYKDKTLSDDEIMSYFGCSEEGIIKSIVPNNYNEALTSFFEHYKAEHQMCPNLFDGIKEVLKYLKAKGVKLALVTGKGITSCKISLSFYGLEYIFEQVEAGAPTGDIKTENIKKVMDNFKLNPKEVLYVGDAPTDIIASKENGIDIASALWGSITNEKAVKELNPDRIFYNINDFYNYLKTKISSNITA